MHAVLTVALLVAVTKAAGAVPGMTHVVWQAAACALQVIMQLVTFEVCARRIRSPADAGRQAALIAATARKIATLRMSLAHAPRIPRRTEKRLYQAVMM
jgi:hypothetical protein